MKWSRSSWLPWRRRPQMGSLRVMRLEAGDMVVLQVKDVLTKATVADIKALLQQQFPNHKVLVLTGGMELSIVRPDMETVLDAVLAPRRPELMDQVIG